MMMQCLCIFFIGLAIASELNCRKLIATLYAEYVANPKLLMKQATPYLAVSGLGSNKWGDYDACIRNGWDYSSIMILLGPLGSEFVGICHSSQCSSQDLNSQEVKNVVKRVIDDSGYLDELGLTIEQFDYSFIEPVHNEMTFMAGFTIFIIIALVILAFSLPAIQLFTNFKTRKQRYQILYLQRINQESIEENEDKIISSNTQKVIEKDLFGIKILKDFSIIENWNQLFKLTTPDPNLQMFTGIRALAFMMVVYGHQYSIISGSTYKSEVMMAFKDLIFLWLIDMLYSVDIFFWIGGFFVGFVLFERKKLDQVRQSPLALGMILLHRLLRLWPCYIMWMLINCNLAPLVSEGPRAFQLNGMFYGKTWWRNLLFIDNLFNDQYYVMGWGWYLSNDIQMFIASMIALLIYAHNPKYGKLMVIILLFATQLTGTILSFVDHYLLPGFQWANLNAFWDYYIKPWTRGPPYFLGLIYGILYREFKSHQEDSIIGQDKEWMNAQSFRKIITQAIFYPLGGTIILFLMFGWREAQINGAEYWSQGFQSFWYAFCRLLFCIGLSLLVFPGIVGIRDMFNKFMNNTIFQFLAKLSFTAYLCHYTIILLTSTNFYETPDFGTRSLIQFYIANFSLSVLFAMALVLFVEMPFAKLEQRLMVSMAGSKQRAKSLESPDMSERLLKK